MPSTRMLFCVLCMLRRDHARWLLLGHRATSSTGHARSWLTWLT
jgi:hypothetical protein